MLNCDLIIVVMGCYQEVSALWQDEQNKITAPVIKTRGTSNKTPDAPDESLNNCF